MTTDVVALCQKLLSFSSVTPDSAGCLEYLADLLKNLGFETYILEFGQGADQVKNLYARWGTSAPHLAFLGHVDVVPPGPLDQWTFPPFSGIIDKGRLYGRGAVDMKGAIACFIDAVAQSLENINGSLSLLLTADEEGPALNGTKKLVEWLEHQQQIPDFCLVGEPTNPTLTNKMIKIGRRGSINFQVENHGVQGHVAYPHQANNPIPLLIDFLQEVIKKPLDQGNQEFDPSSLQITTIDCGNAASNVIPQKISARGNIRFNPLHSPESLTEWLQQTANRCKVRVTIVPSSVPFITTPGPVHSLLQHCIQQVSGQAADFSTTGGTSDAWFIHKYCPVMEFGLNNTTMHKIDEYVELEDLYGLRDIYRLFIQQFFSGKILPTI